MKKALSLLLGITIVLTSCLGFGSTAFADSSYACGNGVTAAFDESTKTLIIDGPVDSEIYNYSINSLPDWTVIDGINSVEDIKHIDVSANIKRIGINAFNGCTQAEDIYIKNENCSIADKSSIPTTTTILIFGTVYNGYKDNEKSQIPVIKYAQENNRQYDVFYYVIFKDAKGNELSKKAYKNNTKGEDIEVPEIIIKPHPRKDRHEEYRYGLNGVNDSGILDVTDNAIYIESVTLVECTYSSEKITPATCTQEGILVRGACTQCGAEPEPKAVPLQTIPHEYTVIVKEAKSPSCTEKGVSEIRKCKNCDAQIGGDYIEPKGHNFVNSVCTVCGAVDKLALQQGTNNNNNNNTSASQSSTTPQPAPQQPSANKPQQKAPAGAKKVKGEWIAPKQKKTSIKKLKKGKKSLKVFWKKASSVSGYQVQLATDKKFKKNKKTVTVKGNKSKNPAKTIKKLKAKKKYYVRVRTYKTVKFNGKSVKVFSKWSKVKSVKIK